MSYRGVFSEMLIKCVFIQLPIPTYTLDWLSVDSVGFRGIQVLSKANQSLFILVNFYSIQRTLESD